MRVFLIFFSIILWGACTNDVTSIGQDLIDDVGNVDKVSYKIINTATIRLDSFPVSMGETSQPLSKLLVGHIQDPITGITDAQPFFEIVPTGGTPALYTYTYDSITFDAKYSGNIWGDTTQAQIFTLHQMAELPTLDKVNDLIYNPATVPYHPTVLGTGYILPKNDNLQKFQFRLDDQLGQELYEMVVRKDEKIREPAYFVSYFKGLTLVADPSNDCMLGLSADPDSLGITLHFHDATQSYTYNFRKSSAYNKYTFNHLAGNPAGTPYAVLTEQTDNLWFGDAKQSGAPDGQAVTQGLNGYLMKMRLPINPASDKYRTIVKAEIIIYPQENSNVNIPLPPTLNVYKSDYSNQVLNAITNSSNEAVIGSLQWDYDRPENTKYVINITDYYSILSQQGNAQENNFILVTIPLDQMNNSFNRLATDELPELNIYYASYE